MFDLEKNIEVEDLSPVPAQFQPFYKDTGAGKFALDMDNPVVKGAVEAVTGLNKALSSERRISKELKGKAVDLSSLSEYGSTVEEIQAGVQSKIEELQQQLSDPKAARVNVQKIKEELGRAFEQEKLAKERQVNELRAQLDTVLIESDARAALADLSDDPDLVLPFIHKHVRPGEEDGKRIAFVVDEQGDRRFNPATGQPMGVRDLLLEMQKIPKYAPLFKSKTPAGMPRPQNGNRPAPRQGQQDLSPTAKIAANLPNLPGMAR